MPPLVVNGAGLTEVDFQVQPDEAGQVGENLSERPDEAVDDATDSVDDTSNESSDEASSRRRGLSLHVNLDAIEKVGQVDFDLE